MLFLLILVEPITPTDSVIKYSSSILIISPLANDVIPDVEDFLEQNVLVEC